MSLDDSRDGARDLVREHLLRMPGYEPVEPIDVVAKRLGIPEDQIVKLDANENPYGPSAKVRETLERYDMYHIYPDPAQSRVREAVADYVGVEPGQVVLGNGSDDLLDLCARLFLSPGDTLVNFPPAFGVYEFLGRIYDANIVDVPRGEDFSLDLERAEAALSGAKLAFLASPNNPTGNLTSLEEIERLLSPGAVIVVDEAYAEFTGESFAQAVGRHDNLIAVRTFSKWAGLAGLRAGYAIVPKPMAEVIWRVKIPYNLTAAAEQAIMASLDDIPALNANVARIIEERGRLFGELASQSWLRPFESEANFLLCEVRGLMAKDVRDRLRERGILVRYFDAAGIKNCLRISVGKSEDTDRLMSALGEIGAGVAG
ncbi:MAG: histidinol-phosphate transaminase [Chloroflexi bacterium]|nr:histidinol-phosphate transaminase [Chloroflexota bacterium]